MRIDAHVHLIEHLAVSCGSGEGRLIENGSVRLATGEIMPIFPAKYKDHRFTAEDCLEIMDQHGVDKAVILQSSFYGLQNEYAAQAVRQYPERFIAVGSLDPYGNQKSKILDRIFRELKIKNLKFEISEGYGLSSFHPEYRVNCGEMEEIYETVGRYGGAIAFDVGGPGQSSYQIRELQEVIRKYKNIKFVICHLLAPRMQRQPNWEEEIRGLNQENVWFEFSSVQWHFPDPYPFPAAAAYVRRAADIAGTDRLLWGTDVPMIITRAKYGELLTYIGDSGRFTDDDIDRMYGENAISVYT